MITMLPASDQRIAELCSQSGAPTAGFCYEASDKDHSLGFVLYEQDSGILTVTALCVGELLADGILRAAFNGGQLAGCDRFAFTPQVLAIWGERLRGMGYNLDGGNLFEFFSTPCKKQS